MDVAVDLFSHIRGENGSHISGDPSLSAGSGIVERKYLENALCHITAEWLEGTGASKSQTETTEKKRER